MPSVSMAESSPRHNEATFPVSNGPCPLKWVFYLVAKIDGRHRPLVAAWMKSDKTSTRKFGERVVVTCSKVMDCLVNPDNRLHIEVERNMVIDYYQDVYSMPKPVYHDQAYKQYELFEFPVTQMIFRFCHWSFQPGWGLFLRHLHHSGHET
ncbi:hypothetical protein F4804DRAFT_316771 [Jackrogersella minutella]|nr:hypothetical protein F4804DRAFT_316771 [Jackrogersella minutella]